MAVDNVATAGYIVYQNDQAVATTTETHYSLTELAAGTDYAFAIAAFDGAGNLSSRSPRQTITTPVFEGGACFSMEFGELESDRPTFHSLGFGLPILRGDPNGNATVQVHYPAPRRSRVAPGSANDTGKTRNSVAGKPPASYGTGAVCRQRDEPGLRYRLTR